MQINLGPYDIEVQIIRKNNKNIYFRIKNDLKLYIYASYLVSKKELLKLIKDNEKSIIKMYEKMLKIIEYEKNFYYLGDKYDIIFDENSSCVIFDNQTITVKNQQMLDNFLKKETKRIFEQRVEKLQELFNYLPSFSLRIRKMKTRWGVCNRKNNIVTLNSELIKKDISLLDYVIIHEFCHFKHPNHSVNFWQEVAKYYPDYKNARKRLKEE